MLSDDFLHLPSQSPAEILATTGQLPNPQPLSSLGPHFPLLSNSELDLFQFKYKYLTI